MADAVSLKIIGDWDKEVGVGLTDALHVSMDVMGKTGEDACRQALWYMAQAASKLAGLTKRKKTRTIWQDEHGKYVNVYTQGRTRPHKVYDWMFSDENGSQRIPGTWQDAKKIGNKGLASRSWMWGLHKFTRGGSGISKALPGKSRVLSIISEKMGGYIKINTLDYILKAMPSGWERMVELSAGNRIMANAVRIMERKFKQRMQRREKTMARGINSFFLRGLQ